MIQNQPAPFDQIVSGARYADRTRPRSTAPRATRGRHSNAPRHPIALGWSFALQSVAGSVAALGFLLAVAIGRVS